MRALPDRDAARERWRTKAKLMGLPDPDGLGPAERRGLARRFTELSTRIAVLPADPFRSDLEFNADVWEWWEEEREAPSAGRCGGVDLFQQLTPPCGSTDMATSGRRASPSTGTAG